MVLVASTCVCQRVCSMAQLACQLIDLGDDLLPRRRWSRCCLQEATTWLQKLPHVRDGVPAQQHVQIDASMRAPRRIRDVDSYHLAADCWHHMAEIQQQHVSAI